MFKQVCIVFILVLLGASLFGQTLNCDKSKIAQSDKELMKQFSMKFKEAINSKNKAALASLIQFPFSCDYCVVDHANKKENHPIKITKELFNRKQYQIFFDSKLQKEVNTEESLYDILIVTTNKKQNCVYSFGYVSVTPSKETEGQQHYFTLQKINDKYFITSAWTVP